MNTPKPGDRIVVWFSCGVASAAAAYMTLRKYGASCSVRLVNNPILEEGPDNPRFARDVSSWLGVPIELAINPEYPNCSVEEVWERRKFMVSKHGAPCTVSLKKHARQGWEALNPHEWLVLGFTAEETGRHARFCSSERDNVLPVLIDAGMTRDDCYSLILGAGIGLPLAYPKGYANANCPGCVKATSPTYWNHVRRVDPEVFESRAKQSRRLGAKLVRYKNKRIFLDELPPGAVGRPMKSVDFECGIFCEERL